ncbi:hypothetical protein Mro03_81290 [Microbispora rosea subsp. rosea]|nr:hypothetical protein Mro03_81290 [Microbispora rosea subsp. rosea]
MPAPPAGRTLTGLATATESTPTTNRPLLAVIQHKIRKWARNDLPAVERDRAITRMSACPRNGDPLAIRRSRRALADLGAADATLAHMAWCGVHYGWPVVSDRMVDLRIVAPGVKVEPLP